MRETGLGQDPRLALPPAKPWEIRSVDARMEAARLRACRQARGRSRIAWGTIHKQRQPVGIWRSYGVKDIYNGFTK